ncbi:hypothetical protein [Microcoleus sp. FACHB-831]|uniref:hypothetical protein n=1 Tax=Microcoleus sp. FACHB-831 TaxID=2692827 RepID=UPI00168277AC|nr:hypothetical protein [Microcoleus sp. FACHB-831]
MRTTIMTGVDSKCKFCNELVKKIDCKTNTLTGAANPEVGWEQVRGLNCACAP